jgi:hypothetical protein
MVMSWGRRKSVLLAALCLPLAGGSFAQTSAQAEQALDPSVLNGLNPNKARIFPLDFDPTEYRVNGFIRYGNGSIALKASRYGEAGMRRWYIFDEFLSGRTTTVEENFRDVIQHGGSIYPREERPVFSAAALTGVPPQVLHAGNTTLTLHENTVFGDFPTPGTCPGGYSGPAPHHIIAEKDGVTREMVLVYVFDHPVRPHPTIPCEAEYLFNGKHKEIRIIAPVLVGKSVGNSGFLLAGRSYTAMPAVVYLPATLETSGLSPHVYFLDKAVVDAINRDSEIEIDRLSRIGLAPFDDGGATLAALIERRLLQETERMLGHD